MFVSLDEVLEKYFQLISKIFFKLWQLLKVLFDKFLIFLLRMIHYRRHLPPLKAIDIIYRSSNFIIVNKVHDILINSNDKSKKTVQSLLKQELDDINLVWALPHRLDFATSGILCITMNRKIYSELLEIFEKELYSKYYLALVRGHVDNEYDIIDIAIGEDIRFKDTSKKMCSGSEKSYCMNIRRSITKLLVLEKGYYNNKPVTKLLLKPITSRRHQLRIHCAEIGNFIVGDYTYSSKSDISPPRMFLHAYRLILPNMVENLDIQTEDPFTEKKLKYKWKITEKFNDFPHAFDLIDSI